MPLSIALHARRPAHRICSLVYADGLRRRVESVATPLVGLGGRFLGVLHMFWEVAE